MAALLKTICCSAAFIALSFGQQQVRTNPFNTSPGVEQGRVLFQLHCSYCHGANGEGGRGADLTTGQYRMGGSDANLFESIRNGIPGTEMPAVRVSDEEVWKLAAFVKKIGSTVVTEKASGDSAAGKTVFEGKGRCTTCHSIGSDGGNLGPDLSDAGRRRSPKYLEESVVSPDADVPIRYRALQVLTKAGQTVTGVRLNEDDISVQLRDVEDNLRSFLKANIREMRYQTPSLMPAYGQTLSKKEIVDVVAYLSSLRGAQ